MVYISLIIRYNTHMKKHMERNTADLSLNASLNIVFFIIVQYSLNSEYNQEHILYNSQQSETQILKP